jgi:hypothetical protein
MADTGLPVTLERAPHPILVQVGHFGEYRDGVAGIVRRIRDGFDPDRILAVPLYGD